MPLNFPENQPVTIQVGATITDETLVAMRRKIFAREACYDTSSNLLVFPLKEGGSIIDTAHRLARGIDVFRAALAIYAKQSHATTRTSAVTLADVFSHAASFPVGSEHQKLCDLKDLEAHFTEFFNTVAELDRDDLQNAKKALKNLNRQLTEELGIKQKSLMFVSHVLYKKTFGKDAARVLLDYDETGEQPSSYHQYQRVEFGDVSAAPPFMQGIQAPWCQALIKKFGPWMESFINENWSVLQASQSPSQRYTPGPANVYEARTVVQQPGDKQRHLSCTLVAVTQPLDVKTHPVLNFLGILQKEPADITLHNQRVLFATEERLEKFAREYHARWKKQLEKKDVTEITLPILHQSLIADAIPGTPDWKKSPLALDYKAFANDVLRKELEKHDYYVSRKNGDVKEYFKNGPLEKDFNKDGDLVKINFCLLETNNCVNQHHKYSRQRRRDVMDARQLVKLAVAHLDRCWGKSLTGDQQTIRNFLTSRNHSLFTPYRYRGKKVKAAMQCLSDSRDDIGLLLSAAVELKCTVHETWLGSARRNLHNIMPSIPGLRWIFVGASFVLSTIAKLPVAPFLMRHWLQHSTTRRKSFYKAAYEQIVAGLLGVSHSGCMSALDRAGEVDIFRAALFQEYCATGQLLGFNDDPKKKDEFLSEYREHAQVKKALAFVATGVPTNSHGELFGPRYRGFISQQQDDDFVIIDNQSNDLRKNNCLASRTSVIGPLEQALRFSENNSPSLTLSAVNFFKSYSAKAGVERAESSTSSLRVVA